MRTFGAVFVLFRPNADALTNLERVRADCPSTVVVDNTPEPDPGLHERLRGQGLVVIANRNVGGLAGAYNRGIDHLVARGVDLCFMLDQDSDVEPGFVTRMTARADAVEAQRFLVGPRVYEIEMDKYLPADVSGEQVAPGIVAVPFVISSGSAVTASAFTELGPFVEGLFIEYVDVEYSLRAQQAGVGVYVVIDEVLRQHTGAITRHGRFFTTNHVAWRRYYLVRNGAWTTRRYLHRRGWWLGSLRQAAREVFVVLAFERGKLPKTAAVVCGLVDGLRGRLGTFEARHPRLQRFCTR